MHNFLDCFFLTKSHAFRMIQALILVFLFFFFLFSYLIFEREIHESNEELNCVLGLGILPRALTFEISFAENGRKGKH